MLWRDRRTSLALDGFAQINPVHDFPPAAAGGIFLFFDGRAHWKGLFLRRKVASEGKPYVIWDSELKGFGVRLTPASRINPHGKASYILQKWERVSGTKKIRHTFGSYPELSVLEARDKAHSIISQIRT